MSWDPPGLEDPREGVSAKRVWLVSPAIATVLFFAAQIFLAGYDSSESVRGAAADTPSAIPVEVRVVAQIKSANDMKPAARVPGSEHELLELFRKEGGVVFSSNEVENIGTQSSEFEDQEVGVITADKQRRVARFRR